MKMARRWIIFVLTGVATFAVGVFVASQPAPRKICRGMDRRPVSQWEVLLSFQNRDLRKLDPQSGATLRQAIDSLTGTTDSRRLTPNLFQLVSNTMSQKCYLLVEEDNSMISPGTSYLRLIFFDLDGRVLNARTAGAYKELFTRVYVGKADSVAGDVLVVETLYLPFGDYRPRQFYAFVETEIRLVYIELNGRFDPTISGDGIARNIQRPVDEWERALFSDDYVEVMSALLWINANHWTGQPMHYDEKEGERVEALLNRNDIRRRLQELKRSNNRWMKTAARSILKTL